MKTLRRRLPALAWMAALALLAMAMLPAVSHTLALARGAGTAWAEVCTPQGMRLVALPAGEAPAPGASAPLQVAGHLEHCPLCTLGQDTPGAPATAPTVARLPAAPGLVPPPTRPTAPAAAPWPCAQPRAPPATA